MPCSAKKFECNRPEMCASGYKDVDYGLTTRELAKMIREAGIDLPAMPKSEFDDPFGAATGSGVIFGATGGVMEAALRSGHRTGDGQEGGEPLRPRRHRARARLRRRRAMLEIPITRGGPGARS